MGVDPVVSVRDLGVRFTVPRHSRLGRTPRLLGVRKHTAWGIRGVSFDIGPDEALGVVGPNGAGKTTLLRAVAGVYNPDEGSVRVRGRIGPLLSLEAGLMHQLSGWENIALLGVLLGLSRKRVAELAPRIAEFSGLGDFLDAEVRTYSAGMRTRLGFAVAAFTDPEVLILDEVLMVGDEDFRRVSFSVMRDLLGRGRPTLLASHDLEHMAELCTRVLYLERGSVVEIGDPRQVIERYRSVHAPRPPEELSPGRR